MGRFRRRKNCDACVGRWVVEPGRWRQLCNRGTCCGRQRSAGHHTVESIEQQPRFVACGIAIGRDRCGKRYRGDVQKGADIAKSARAYNYLNHHEVDDLVKDLKGCRSAADPKLCRTDIAAQYKTISDKTTNSKLGGCAGETGCFEQLEVVDGATKALDQYASDKDLGPEEKNIIQDFQESNFHDYVIARNIWLSGFLKEVTPIILSGGAGAVTKAEGTAGKTAAAETELGGGAKGIVNATSHKADDIRFSQNTVTFNKTDKEGALTYSDLVKSMKSEV